MDFPASSDIQRRLRERKRSEVQQWVLQRHGESGLATGQHLSANLIEAVLRPAQSTITAELISPLGENIGFTLHPNGSLLLDTEFAELSALEPDFLSGILPEFALIISDLFHGDALQFSHAVIRHDAGFCLRTVSSIAPDRTLTALICEALALKDSLLSHLETRLRENGFSDATADADSDADQ